MQCSSICLGELHAEAVEESRVYILDDVGMAQGPLFEGWRELGADFIGAVQKEWLSAVEAFLDAVAGQQQVQQHFAVLLILMEETEQIFHLARIRAHPSVFHAPLCFSHHKHEKESLSEGQEEETRNVLENPQEGKLAKVLALMCDVAQHWENLRHLPSLIGLS